MADARDELLHGLCDACAHPPHHTGCGWVFQSLLAPIACPEPLHATHAVCPWCLDVRPHAESHTERCIFAQLGCMLHAAGWATSSSGQVLRALRYARFPYSEPLANVVSALLKPHVTSDTIIVPIPMSSRGVADRWSEFVTHAAAPYEGTPVLPLIQRHKQRSTRQSTSQQRRAITSVEYSVDDAASSAIRDRSVILLDDNVTTGATLAGCIALLQAHGPATVIPIAIERHISPRVLQRCPEPPVACSFFTPRQQRAPAT